MPVHRKSHRKSRKALRKSRKSSRRNTRRFFGGYASLDEAFQTNNTNTNAIATLPGTIGNFFQGLNPFAGKPTTGQMPPEQRYVPKPNMPSQMPPELKMPPMKGMPLMPPFMKGMPPSSSTQKGGSRRR